MRDLRKDVRSWKTQELEVDSHRRRHYSITEPELIVELVMERDNIGSKPQMRWRKG